MADEQRSGWQALRLTLALLGVAVCVTLWCVVVLRPSSAGAYAFAVGWLALPNAAMAALLFALWHRGKPLLLWCVAAVLVAAGGIYVLVDAIYLHPDPQSAIAVFIAPVFQGVAFLLAAPMVWWLSRRGEKDS